jgi:acyl carrier protein
MMHLAMTDGIRTAVRGFVVENFLYGASSDTLADDQSFLDTGIIDSTGVLELVGFLEREFGVAVEDDELTPTNLDSVTRLVSFVTRKLEAKGAHVAS